MDDQRIDLENCVYVKELDSVNSSPQEQVEAERKLFYSLVFDGKKVILTYNQIGDSVAFLHCITRDESAEYIYRFFKNERILINQYNKEKNLSRYIQESLLNTNFKSSFFYFLETMRNKNEIYYHIQQAIQYNDESYVEKYKEQLNDNYSYVLQYIKTIITINTYLYENHHQNYVPSYINEKDISLSVYIHHLLDELKESPHSHLIKDIEMIEEDMDKNAKNKRSVYLNKIAEHISDETNKVIAINLVNLAYNLKLEDNIFSMYGESYKIDAKKEVAQIFKQQETTINNEKVIESCCPWEDGYRAVSITTALSGFFKGKVKWSLLLKCVPIIEILRILVSLFVTIILMNVSDFFDFIQSSIVTGFLGILISIFFDWIISLGEEVMAKWLPEWSVTSPIEEMKYFIKDVKLVWLKKVD